jgi:hypothetical protein
MPNLNIGNEVVDTCQAKKLIKRNIEEFQHKIARLNMNSVVGIRMLCFYAKRIKDQELLLQWIVKAEQGKEKSQAA